MKGVFVLAAAGALASGLPVCAQEATPLSQLLIEAARNNPEISWRIERLFAWLQNFRRLVTRYERNAENFLGMLHLGCTLILL
jgi:hypothetical protein